MHDIKGFDKHQQGYVFNIQHYSVHDGPGIRTIVFLKGCPLKCKWCSNPESQQLLPVLAYNQSKCIGIDQCLYCVETCTYGAITRGDDNRIAIDRDLCSACLLCAENCPAKALIAYGKLRTVQDVLDAVEGDSMFYARSGGGLTLSGGEPLLQHEFAISLLKEAKRRRINTTIETSGYSSWEVLEQVAPHLDSIIYDIKCMDPEKHQQFTGVSNEQILLNLRLLDEHFPQLPKLIRTAVIPGFNDSIEDIQAIIDYIKDMPNMKYELLPYHRMGQPKYEYLGKEYLIGDAKVSDEKMKAFNELVAAAKISVR